jgi:hypothetical protein
VFDPIVTPKVAKARDLSRKALIAELSGWPDIAIGYRNGAKYWMRLARYLKGQRLGAGVYGTMIRGGAA